MPSEKPWTSSSALPRNWILTKIMPPDCLAWQPGGVFVCGGFGGYGMTRRNVVYLPIYSRFQSTCHIRGMTLLFNSATAAEGISIHMPHTWHDTCCRTYAQTVRFQSTCHIRGMTHRLLAPADKHLISIHMPHTWHDSTGSDLNAQLDQFQSTCHIRGMTSMPSISKRPILFQSTCHIRGMTPERTPRKRADAGISIHMPHTWHDARPCRRRRAGRNCNPHATYVA